MELIDLTPIKPMLMRGLSNPEAIKLFINYNLSLLGSFWLLVLRTFIVLSLLYFAYLLWKNKGEKSKKEIIKKSVFEYLKKVKKPLRKLRYLIIWGILISLSRLLVSRMFYIYNLGLTWYNCTFSAEENKVLEIWALLSLIIFLIAPLFIMFCFGNKFIRNIWILIYIFWVWFIAMWKLISISCVWMENEEELKEIENVGEVEDIKEIGTFWGLKTL